MRADKVNRRAYKTQWPEREREQRGIDEIEHEGGNRRDRKLSLAGGTRGGSFKCFVRFDDYGRSHDFLL